MSVTSTRYSLAYKKFRVIKPEIRVLGVGDGLFTPYSKGLVPRSALRF
jgi:hypothetical protein